MRADTQHSRQYRFADFTHAAYARLLALAKARYGFVRYHDTFDPAEPCVLWRHDLDFSIEDALPLARMEAAAGVAATYFVNLHCNFYNPFDAESLGAIAEIAGLGHEIGLHFDFAVVGARDETELSRKLGEEAAVLRMQYGVPVRAFSFHNPTAAALAFDAPAYGGLANAYGRHLRNGAGYCSDSNGYWRFEPMEQVLSRPARGMLQVLTHPTWWTAEVMSPKEKIERTVARLGTAILEDYTATLASHGRKDIDW